MTLQTEEKIEALTVSRSRACKILGISEASFGRLMRAGALPVVRLGAMRRYNVEELKRLARVGFELPKKAS